MCIITKYYCVHFWVSSVNSGHVKSRFITYFKSRGLDIIKQNQTELQVFSVDDDSIAFIQVQAHICVNAHMWVYVRLLCVSPSLISLK